MEPLADKIIAQLEGVKTTGRDRWIARCPSHEDRSPSLAIKEVDDRLLLHCFAGCSVDEIISSVGLEMGDLFPEKITTGNKPLSKPFPAADILRCLSSEITYLMICASDLAKGEKLDAETQKKLLRSASRFKSALTAGGLQ